jgi:hypothetical protein
VKQLQVQVFVRSAILLLIPSVLGVAQQPEAAVEIRLANPVVTLGVPVTLNVVIKNVSNVDLRLLKESPNSDGHAEDYLHLEVRDADGKLLPRIDVTSRVMKNGKNFSLPKRGWGSRKGASITPHGELRDYLILSDLFDLSKPGAYSVSAQGVLQKPYSGPEIKWVETAAEKIDFAVVEAVSSHKAFPRILILLLCHRAFGPLTVLRLFGSQLPDRGPTAHNPVNRPS